MRGARVSGVSDPATPTDLIQSLQRGLRVLEYVVGAGRPVAPKQVAAALGLNLSTTYHLVNTLVYEGYLTREAGRGLVPGRGVTSGPDPRGLGEHPRLVPIRRALGRAAYAVNDVALMTTMHDGEAVVTAAEAVPGAPNFGRYGIGSRHLPHASAAGRAMLASQDDSVVARSLERCRAMAAERGAEYDHDRVVAEVIRVRTRGYGFAESDADGCVGAPVFDHRGRPVGAVAIAVTPRRLATESAKLIETVQRTAQVISHVLTRLELSEEWPGGLPALSHGLIGSDARPPDA